MKYFHHFSVLLFLLCHLTTAADLTTWPRQYLIDPWETNRLTAADVVGPDGIVYPDWTGVGVTGGIPSVDPVSPPAGYTVYNVTSYGANGGDTANDDTAVASALTAALANANSTNKSILYFPAGTYYLNTARTINKSGVVVAGAGKTNTVIKLNPTTGSGSLFQFQTGATWGGNYLTATTNLVRGSSNVVFTVDPAANGYTNGTWIRIVATDESSSTDTMRSRYSNPNAFIEYTDPMWHFGRVFIAKITSINSGAKTVTLDRTFAHDYFPDELPQMRRVSTTLLEFCGLQNLTIETLSNSVAPPLDPVQFQRAANCWIKGVRILKARDWPISPNTDSRARFEIRDCDFEGTWANINNGSRAYLGWGQADMDCLMANCTAQDLRHMAIFQMASRCVIRNCDFSGETVQSPQQHGRFPLENLIEGCTFIYATPRGKTAYAIDPASSLVHGPNGPRNVFYNNRIENGSASMTLGGASENQILVYNRLRAAGLNAQIDALPPIWAADRTFDTIVRGNIFDCLPSSPVINLEDPTCTGWRVSDNLLYNSNGYLWAGPAALEVNDNNRFRTGALPTDNVPEPQPEVASIYLWQKTNAALSRILLVIDKGTVSENGGVTTARVVRVHTTLSGALAVNLSASPAGAVSLPASVTIPDGEVSVSFSLAGLTVSAETTVNVTASTTGLGLNTDTDTIAVLDDNGALPDFGKGRLNTTATNLPANWRTADFARASVAGSVTHTNGAFTLKGAGPRMETYMGNMGRSGRRGVWQAVRGDGSITARLLSYTGSADVGLMITDDEAPITEFITVEPARGPLSSGDDSDSDCSVNSFGTNPGLTLPAWLKLTRAGSVVTALSSTDGITWTTNATVDWYRNVGGDYKTRATIDQEMYFGMFVNSGSETTLATAVFTNVVVIGDVIPVLPATPTNLLFSVSGTNLILFWPADYAGWELQAQTNNLDAGLGTNWSLVAGSTATNQAIIPLDPANPAVFYRLHLP